MAKKSTRKKAGGKKARRKKRSSETRRRSQVAAPTAEATPSIRTWATDPMDGLPPLLMDAPDTPGGTLPTRIIQPVPAPPPQVYATGTSDFRYWTGAEALRRAADFWVAAGVSAWHPNIGTSIPVRLDDGIDLNAYYARNDFPPLNIKKGLSFFHDTVVETATGNRTTVFSGESPDVVEHELGHAVLDAIKPALFGASSTEAAAFHESFADQSAILTALQLPSIRQAVLDETGGHVRRNSLVSRVAEQLGFAIRQRSPSAVDPDSLRNASNSFTYVDPTTLPASGPASILTRSPHNFSRVFTGAFLEALSGMVLALADLPNEGDLLQASEDMSRLLVRGIVNAPVRTRFFQAVAEQLVLADEALFSGRYAQALTTAFVRRGLLPLRFMAAPGAASADSIATAAAAAARLMASLAGGAEGAETAGAAGREPIRIALDGTALGLPVATVFVHAPAIDYAIGDAEPVNVAAEANLPGRYAAAQAFVEELVLSGNVTMGTTRTRMAPLLRATSRRRVTHQLVRTEGGLELQRLTFE